MVSSSYDGCGSDISLLHALDCHNGGQVIQYHNEVRDTLGDLAYRDVNCELIVQEGGGNGAPPMMNEVAVLIHDAERKLISLVHGYCSLVHFV